MWSTFSQKNPKRNIIYLTADSPNVLQTVNPGDVLVLGGVVDHKEKPAVALDRAEAAAAAAAGWSTARLPLAGHVRLLKNAHLPCLAVVQLLIVQREVAADNAAAAAAAAAANAAASTSSSTAAAAATSTAGSDRVAAVPVGGSTCRPTVDSVLMNVRGDDGDEDAAAAAAAALAEQKEHTEQKEGGEMAAAWGEAIARCPAFRCAPLHKYVRWLPPYEHLNGSGGGAKPRGVTDVRALTSI